MATFGSHPIHEVPVEKVRAETCGVLVDIFGGGRAVDCACGEALSLLSAVHMDATGRS